MKVCGLTRVSDAQAAQRAGASYLGFIFYSKSPRCIGLDRYKDIAGELPDLPKVAVTVVPGVKELEDLEAAGFDFFQIHFPVSESGRVKDWARAVGKERLWLAPKIGPGECFDEGCLAHCETILWDGFKKDASVFGGTGETSDWLAFKELREKHPQTRWILAGGLGPENARAAARETGTSAMDFNSGLESSPGVKDPELISRVRLALLER